MSEKKSTKRGKRLDKVLYVRVQRALLVALDKRLKEERRRNPGRIISRADLARELLLGALANEKQE